MDNDDLYGDESGIKELTPKDFDSITAKNIKLKDNIWKPSNKGFLIFYAPWCPHCRQTVENWKEIAIQFKYRWYIGAINCDNIMNQNLCREVKLEVYPTVWIIENGKLVDKYTENNKDEIIKFILLNT